MFAHKILSNLTNQFSIHINTNNTILMVNTYEKRLKSIFDASSGWLCVLLIGAAAGCCAGLVDITTKWLADIKLGICTGSFFLNREQEWV